jgi:hypothetical protein
MQFSNEQWDDFYILIFFLSNFNLFHQKKSINHLIGSLFGDDKNHVFYENYSTSLIEQ